MTCSTTVNLCAVYGVALAISVENLRTADGELLDLAGVDLLMRIRARVGGSLLLELSTAGGQLAAPVPGAVVIEVDEATIRTLPQLSIARDYVQSLIATEGGNSAQVWEGVFTLRPDPTQSWSL